MKVNMKTFKNTLTGIVNKHGGKITTAITVGAFIGSNVCTAIATKKSIDAVAKNEAELQRALSKSEKFKITWKYWSGTAGFITVGVTSSVVGTIASAKKVHKIATKFEIAKEALQTADEKLAKKEKTINAANAALSQKDKLINSYKKAVDKVDTKAKNKINNEVIKNEVDNGNIPNNVLRIYEDGKQLYLDTRFNVIFIADARDLELWKEKVKNELLLGDLTVRDTYDILGDITGHYIDTKFQSIVEERGFIMGSLGMDETIDFDTNTPGKWTNPITGETVPVNLFVWLTEPGAV